MTTDKTQPVPGGGSLKTAYALSWVAAVLMTIVSAVGTFAPEWLYRDNPLVTYAFSGQDMVSLFVAVPLLVAALVFERRGRVWARICWLAMLSYTAYGYLFYAFGAAFNLFFLLYVALFACSMYALIFSLPRIDVVALTAGLQGRFARGAALGYMSVSALGLGILWTAMSLGFVFTGNVPAPVVASGHPTGVVFALDLAVIVPLMSMGVVQLSRRKPWGWAIAAVMSVKGTVYTLGLCVATIVVSRAGVGSGGELPIWAGLTALGAVSLVALVSGSKRHARRGAAASESEVLD